MPARTPGWSGTETVDPLELARIAVGVREHPAAVLGRLGDPAGQEPPSPASSALLEPLDAAPVLGERLGELGAVVEKDVDPDPRVRAGDARHVAQRAARRRERVVPVDACPRRPG